MTMNRDPNLPQDADSRRFPQLGLLNRLYSQLSFKRDTASKRFAQLGLLVGSHVFLGEDQSDPQPQQLENLMRWTLNHENLPPMQLGEKVYKPQLGVSAQGLALICFTLLQAKEERQEPLSEAHKAAKKTVTEVLTHLGIPPTSTLGNCADPRCKYQRFDLNIIAKFVERLGIRMKTMGTAKPHIAATTRRMCIWLDDPQDIDWWVTAIRETLNDYLQLIREKKLNVPQVERLGERLECSVFAPLNISQPLPTPGLTAEDDMPPKMQNQLTDLAEKVDEAVRRVYGARREPRYLYLTWDFFAFDFWMDQSSHYHLVQRTMLALWTAWPQNTAWAPPSPKGFSSPSFSLEETTPLLKDLLPALRRYFFAIKDAHHLPSPELTFEFRTLYPPTFYFADPTTRLPTTDKYPENEDVRHLISNCIGYNDPYAETLSWSTLEGSIATVRGETTRLSHHKAYYLLLPIAARPAQDEEETGSDLDQIVDFLTYQEYTIGLTAEDIYKQARDIESKRAVDSETINTVDSFTRRLARLVSTLPREAFKSGAEEFVELQLLLGRVQYALEKMRSEAIEIEQWYKRLVNGQMEYQRENTIIAPVSKLLSLSAALKDNYPFRSLQGQMRHLSVYTAQLADISKRIGTLLAVLSRAISNAELKERERHDRQIQLVVALITAGTLFVALSAFFPNVDAQAIFDLFKSKTMYTSNTGIIALAMLSLAVLLSLLWLCVWLCVRIWRRMTANSKLRQEDIRISEHVGQFWDLAEYRSYRCEEEKRHKEGKLALLPFLFELCARSWRYLRVRELEQEDVHFSEHVRQFWELAEYTAYKYEEKKDEKKSEKDPLPPLSPALHPPPPKEKSEKDPLPPLSPALHPPPPSWFTEHWYNRGPDSIDSRATWIMEGLWHYLDHPLQESSTNKRSPWTDNKRHASEDTLAHVRLLRRLINVFVLRPDLIPLPRALCILRYKSIPFLEKEKPTIGDNEFRDSLMNAGFTLDQVKSLQDWLFKTKNLNWILKNSVDNVAEALKNAGITASPPKGVVDCWQEEELSSYSSKCCFVPVTCSK